jgi:hypothetical protein
MDIKIMAGLVAYAYNLSYWGDGDQEDPSSRPACAKFSQDSISNNSWAWGLTPVIPATWEAQIEGS